MAPKPMGGIWGPLWPRGWVGLADAIAVCILKRREGSLEVMNGELDGIEIMFFMTFGM